MTRTPYKPLPAIGCEPTLIEKIAVAGGSIAVTVSNERGDKRYVWRDGRWELQS